MKIAIVHEYLIKHGGAERVLDELLKVFPEAEIFTFVYDEKEMGDRYASFKIHPSFMQKLPFGKKKFAFPLMPQAAESFDLSGFEVVISNSHSFAKGIVVPPDILHICYLHTPTRYLWHDKDESLKNFAIPKFLQRAVAAKLSDLRSWDFAAAQRPDLYIANSKNVARRIKKYYRRKARVIYPPVDSDFFKPGKKDGDFFLVVSRLEPHKKVDLSVAAFNELPNKLKIVGTGSEEARLKKMARGRIDFLGELSDNEVRKYYQRAQAFIFPQEEDFGITPLEAASCGRPTIAFNRGGAKETVIRGLNGVLFEKQTSESLKKAVKQFQKLSFDKERIREHALKFSAPVFREKWRKLVFEELKKFKI